MTLINTDIAALDSAHHLHPVCNPAGLKQMPALQIVRGEGCYLFDTDGNRYFDAIAGLASVPIGYSNAALADAAAEQLRTLPYYHSFFHMGNEPSAKLAARLAEITPEGIDHFFFGTSGSDAVETAVKIAWQYWRAVGKPNKRIILAREHAYHGNTIFTTGITGIDHYQHGFGIDPMPQGHIRAPYALHEAAGEPADAFGLRAALWLEERILDLGADNIAAFIGEPVQGTGGGIYPPHTYWPAVREICDKHGILLIADEVMTGFGRLGQWFGQQHFGFVADLMTMSKGLTSSYLPMSATGIHSRIMDALVASGDNFVHGFTASAHPTCAALALANLDVFERDNLVERVRSDIGPYFRGKLDATFGNHPAVAEVRGGGLMLAVELNAARYEQGTALDQHDLAAPIILAMLMRGFILRNNGPTLMISPPLIMTHEQGDEFVAALLDEINKFDAEHRAVAAI
jgi:putrescine---pyruvate transaminase